MEAISAVEARIGSIEARLRALAPPTAGPAADGFAAALAAATAAAPRPAPLGAAGVGGAAPLGLGSSFGLPPAAGGTGGTGGLTPATRLAPGQYPRLSPPAELVGYGNGRIPAGALQPINASGSHRLWGPAAAAFTAMEADARQAGVQLGVTDSYRSLEVQERLAREKGLYRDGGLAAVPGTSNHGWGLSLDLDLDAAGQRWMRDNGWRYGFVEDVPREPWHWTYRPAGAGS